MFLLHDTVVKVQDSSCASLGERADQASMCVGGRERLLQESQCGCSLNTQEGFLLCPFPLIKYPQHVSSSLLLLLTSTFASSNK